MGAKRRGGIGWVGGWWLVGCGGAGVANVQAPSEPVAAPTQAAVAPSAPVFENPGGMWMPHQMVEHASRLRSLGLQIDPAALSEPTSPTLQAVVSLGNCSASFVSPDGLVITNHHCAVSALQQNSSAERNLFERGLLARRRDQELSNGPASRVFVTDKVSDVTDAVLAGLAQVEDDGARFREAEARQKDIVRRCEAAGEGVRCTVASFYEGAKFYLIEQLEIRDVRLVMAPEGGIGNYGGEVDNWQWPRHTGDFAFYRAYVGPHGKPADYSPDNVPYRPKSHLRLAKQPLKQGELIMVAGYPGRTYSLRTHAEVEAAVTFDYPRRQRVSEENLAALAKAGEGDAAAALIATSYVRRFGNLLTNTKGQLEGLGRGGLLQQKAQQERELSAFVESDPGRRQAYQGVLEAIAKVNASRRSHREADAELQELSTPKLLGAALTLVRMADNRSRRDSDRDLMVQERNWPRLRQSLDGLDREYHPKVDQALLAAALKRMQDAPESERSGALAALRATAPHAARQGEAALAAALYRGTKLDDAATRRKLFDEASLATLRTSNDPLIVAALAVWPLIQASERQSEAEQGALMRSKGRYLELLSVFKNAPIAPDANSTLRITYGTVRGYSPREGAAVYRPFTLLSELVKKATGARPFDAPEALLAAAREPAAAPYLAPELGDVPVNFLGDLHITGGNSGSATLDARGELTGLVFDGNYEALGSDWQFRPQTTRSIHVDARFIRYVLDKVYHASELLSELDAAGR